MSMRVCAKTMSEEPDIATAPTTAISQEHNDEQECFRLFDLPTELVLWVLEFAVVISTREQPLLIQARSREPWVTSREDLSAKQPAITRTCRLLREEGLKLFYARNILLGASSDHDGLALWEWADAVGPKNLQRVDQLYIAWVGNDGSSLYAHRNGELINAIHGAEVDAGRFLSEVDWLDDNHHHRTGVKTQSYFFRLNHGKILLDVAHSEPRYRLSFGDQSQDEANWIAADIDVCANGLGMLGTEFWVEERHH